MDDYCTSRGCQNNPLLCNICQILDNYKMDWNSMREIIAIPRDMYPFKDYQAFYDAIKNGGDKILIGYASPTKQNILVRFKPDEKKSGLRAICVGDRIDSDNW